MTIATSRHIAGRSRHRRGVQSRQNVRRVVHLSYEAEGALRERALVFEGRAANGHGDSIHDLGD